MNRKHLANLIEDRQFKPRDSAKNAALYKSLSVNSPGTSPYWPHQALILAGHGGPIASVGQRMISGAARMVIDQFFKCAAEKLSG